MRISEAADSEAWCDTIHPPGLSLPSQPPVYSSIPFLRFYLKIFMLLSLNCFNCFGVLNSYVQNKNNCLL